jgi:hypothetical protein
VASPTLAAQLEAFLAQYPQARWVQWEPFGRHNAREGSRLAFGEYVEPQYDLGARRRRPLARRRLPVHGAAGAPHARAFASRRRIEGDRAALNRLYAVESTPTNTGTKADHRLPLRASDIEAFARAVAGRLGAARRGARRAGGPTRGSTALVRDLEAARGRSLVIAGDGSRRPCTRSRTR